MILNLLKIFKIGNKKILKMEIYNNSNFQDIKQTSYHLVLFNKKIMIIIIMKIIIIIIMAIMTILINNSNNKYKFNNKEMLHLTQIIIYKINIKIF